MAKGDDIQARLLRFAVRILRVCDSLPKTPAGQHVAGQLLRCGTSPAPNYGEGRNAESRRDFVHKLRIVLKELNETHVWLLIIVQSEMLPADQMNDLSKECEELCKIIFTSIQTAQSTTRP